jgi:hypothetical protein
MTSLKFKDHYGQYVTVHDETLTGNIRIQVRTTLDINKVGKTSCENCDVETDISIDPKSALLLHATLSKMLADYSNDR